MSLPTVVLGLGDQAAQRDGYSQREHSVAQYAVPGSDARGGMQTSGSFRYINSASSAGAAATPSATVG
jgi:hypothetical protein